jgi:hypothetical protein
MAVQIHHGAVPLPGTSPDPVAGKAFTETEGVSPNADWLLSVEVSVSVTDEMLATL